MDGAAAGGGAVAIIAIVGFVFRTGVRIDRQARRQQRYAQPPPPRAPVRTPPPALHYPQPNTPPPVTLPHPGRTLDPQLTAAAHADTAHPDHNISQIARAYLGGYLSDAQYADSRAKAHGLVQWRGARPAPEQPEDAVPPGFERA